MNWDYVQPIVELLSRAGWIFRLTTSPQGAYIARFEKRKALQDPGDEKGDEVFTAESTQLPEAVADAALLVINRK